MRDRARQPTTNVFKHPTKQQKYLFVAPLLWFQSLLLLRLLEAVPERLSHGRGHFLLNS
jgi:hypothetical protein